MFSLFLSSIYTIWPVNAPIDKTIKFITDSLAFFIITREPRTSLKKGKRAIKFILF